MTKHSVTLNNGLLTTLTAEFMRSDVYVTLNDCVDQKYIISRLLTCTFCEHGDGVFQNDVNLTGTRRHSVYKFRQDVDTVQSPREYLTRVMSTVNAARAFYNLQPIEWEHVEDKRKVYLGGLLVTATRSGYIYLDGQIGIHIIRPVDVQWSAIANKCINEPDTVDYITEALDFCNVKRTEAGLTKLKWEVLDDK